MPEIDY